MKQFLAKGSRVCYVGMNIHETSNSDIDCDIGVSSYLRSHQRSQYAIFNQMEWDSVFAMKYKKWSQKWYGNCGPI